MPRSRFHQELSIAERGRIIGLWESGQLSMRSISRQMNIHHKTVSNWIKRWQEEYDLHNKSRSGRPRETSSSQDEAIRNAAVNESLTNTKKIKHQLQLQCSSETIRKRLREFGFKHHRPAMKEYLTNSHKEARLGFALQYLPYTHDFWKSVIFSDEKTFASNSHGELHCYRQTGTRYSPGNIAHIRKSGYKSINMWGWISTYGPGELVQIHGQFNSSQYINILESVLLPTVSAIYSPGHSFSFVQDNCPVHTSRIVKQWFQQHPEINCLSWPAKAADLNPIENVWGKIVQEWNWEDSPSSHTVLIQAQQIWEKMRRQPDMFENLIESIPSRLSEVIDVAGNWTSY